MVKTAFVHDWLYSLSGAEKTLEALYTLYPSPIYTLIHHKNHFHSQIIPETMIHTSLLQKLPFGKSHYPYFLPLFPLAIERHNLFEYDAIISSSSCVAKNILTHSEQFHICYCHTPMRYIWDLYFDYLELYNLSKGLKGLLAQFFFQYLRSWDQGCSQRVDLFIANSHTVARRIEKLYGKKAKVIHPPVEVNFFSSNIHNREDFYFTCSRLVPYKKIDLIVEAFKYMPQKTLVVAGEGPQAKKIKSIATKNVHFLGGISNDHLKNMLQKAKAFLYMAHEDFGIAPIEAQSCATPVIAFGKGGCRETILDGKTGILFHSQSPQALIEAIHLFEKKQDSFDPTIIRNHAQQFSKERFLAEFKKTFDEAMEKRNV